ncbi:toll/interleukin-1 receptor domain-containing protein [Azonexus sp.]|uniref:toll/interleukin-1 receptor domain-containing protein n=1 Tax=Azonexus sp. TaxID=1872668 RepID=UPI0035B28B26
MPIKIDILRAAAQRTKTFGPHTLTEARMKGAKTAFLCHSHRDAELAKGLVHLLAEAGWSVYIDWEDSSMPEQPNQETAAKIQQKIKELNYFLFLATANSMSSRWCPWEIGYADGQKPNSQLLIVPTTDGSNSHGNEYLQLYRRVDLSNQGSVEVWQPGQSYTSVPIRSL